MNQLSIRELFKNYNDVNIPPDIDQSALVNPTVSQCEVSEDSLLFITEKVGDGHCTFDAKALGCCPFAIVASRQQDIKSFDKRIIRVGNVRAALSYALFNLYSIKFEKIKFWRTFRGGVFVFCYFSLLISCCRNSKNCAPSPPSI